MNQSPTNHCIAPLLQPFIDRHVLAGAVVLIANREEVLSLEAVGYSDLGTRSAMQTDALFWIASTTKPMTGTALMMLVEEGLVSVEDPVEKYLPEFRGQMVIVEKDEEHVLLRRPQRLLLVRDILSHTGGLPFISPIEWLTVGGCIIDLSPLRTAVQSYAMTPLAFEPGTQYSYSNAGTNTVGRIIEVVSGLSYVEFMEERLFKPLGMNDTTFNPNEKQLHRLAEVYKCCEDKNGLEKTTISQLSYPLSKPLRYPAPAGGLFSTANDVSKFARMILSGGEFEGRHYLSESLIRQMTAKQTAPAIEKGYGFGWANDAEGTFGHGGAYKNDMTIDPILGLVTVFMVQQMGDWGSPQGAEIMPLIKKEATKLRP